MNSDYQVKLEAEPNAGDMQALVKGLTAFNASQTNGDHPDYLLATVRDGEGALIGGLLGATCLAFPTSLPAARATR